MQASAAAALDEIIPPPAQQDEADRDRREQTGSEEALGELIRQDRRLGRHSFERQKEALIDGASRGLVCDPKTHAWLFRFAADLLLVHGGVPEVYEAMSRFMADLRGVRELELREKKRPSRTAAGSTK